MIILDTNTVMGILEQRRSYEAVIQVLESHKDQRIAISTLTLSNVFYFVEKHADGTRIAEQLLRSYAVIGVLPEDAAWVHHKYAALPLEIRLIGD